MALYSGGWALGGLLPQESLKDSLRPQPYTVHTLFLYSRSNAQTLSKQLAEIYASP